MKQPARASRVDAGRGFRGGSAPPLVSRVGRAVGLCVALGLWAPSIAAKPSWKEIAESNRVTQVGRGAEAKKDFQAALEAYEQALVLHDTSGGRRRLARVKAALGKLVEAQADLQFVLDNADASADQKAKARQELAALVARTPGLELVLPEDFSGEVLVGGEPVSISEFEPGVAYPLNPGEHQVVVRAPGFEEFSAQLELAEGQLLRLEALLSPLVEEPQTPPPATERAEASSGSALPTLGYIGLGVGVGGVLLGSYFGYQALSIRGDLRDVCPDQRCSEAQRHRYQDGKDQADYSTIAFSVGGAGLALGLLFLWLAPDDGPGEAQPALSVNAGIHSVWIDGRF